MAALSGTRLALRCSKSASVWRRSAEWMGASLVDDFFFSQSIMNGLWRFAYAAASTPAFAAIAPYIGGGCATQRERRNDPPGTAIGGRIIRPLGTGRKPAARSGG